jgi:hypothetical protein
MGSRTSWRRYHSDSSKYQNDYAAREKDVTVTDEPVPASQNGTSGVARVYHELCLHLGSNLVYVSVSVYLWYSYICVACHTLCSPATSFPKLHASRVIHSFSSMRCPSPVRFLQEVFVCSATDASGTSSSIEHPPTAGSNRKGAQRWGQEREIQLPAYGSSYMRLKGPY